VLVERLVSARFERVSGVAETWYSVVLSIWVSCEECVVASDSLHIEHSIALSRTVGLNP
jgi:hypothetical protein